MTRRLQPVNVPFGFSFLELQVALVVLGIALAGLGPLVVMHLKQMERVEQRTSDGTVYYLVPSTDGWARKLGAAASIQTADPGPPPSPPMTLIDDADAAYGESGPDSWHSHTRDAFNDLLRCHSTGSGTNIARWQFTGLSPGWYEVLATWCGGSDQAPDAPYTVWDGTEFEDTIRVDQSQEPTGPVFNGRPWTSLGVFALQATSLAVELSDDANDDRVVADAVRIVPIRNLIEVLSIDKSLTDDSMTVRVSVWEETPP